MIDGYLKVAAITPNVRVADVEFNCNEICKCIDVYNGIYLPGFVLSGQIIGSSKGSSAQNS